MSPGLSSKPISVKRAFREAGGPRALALLALLAILAALAAGGCSGPTAVNPADPKAVVAELKPQGEDAFLKRDYKAARAPLEAAARVGSLRAIYFLRILSETGLDGAAPNPDEAHRLLSILAASEKTLTSLAERGPSKDRPIYRAALGTLWLRGYLGPAPDPRKAQVYAGQASRAGLLPANNLAAAALLSGGTGSFLGRLWGGSAEEAWEMTLDAARAGDVIAMGNASYMARSGIGTDADPYLGATWARRAASLPEATPRVQNDLGFYYEQGLAVTPDTEVAARWYQMAAARGYPQAQSNLARLKAGGAGKPEVFEGIEY
jgi:TPR repeat protein